MKLHPSARRLARALLVIALLGAFGRPSAAEAEPLAHPMGPVLLTVTGSIAETNAPGRAELDQKMLEALGVEQIVTSTNWTDGTMTFEGVPARKVLAAVGATGTTVVAAALDDYAIAIPISDFTRYPVLIAWRMNGRALAPSDKGPLWIVYPRDSYPELRDATMNARWVWQLTTLDVK